jgi:hypothetical protein
MVPERVSAVGFAGAAGVVDTGAVSDWFTTMSS